MRGSWKSLPGVAAWLVVILCLPGVVRAQSRDSSSVRKRVAPHPPSPPPPSPDSAVHLVAASRLPGRTFRDSFSLVATIRKGLRHPAWQGAAPDPPPAPGAILPQRRIIAFYGNPLSAKMGILGEIPPPQMLARLDEIVREWNAADSSMPALPALHLIAVTAQGKPGRDGMHRLRMDSTLIRKVHAWAQEHHAILILDIQAGHSTIQQELPRLLPWLAQPDIHLAIDPEFYMHYGRTGKTPGSRVGVLDASDVNYAIEEVAKLVTQYHLPPKVLIVHRFTKGMLQNAARIRLDPRVQVVINMDGWGQPWLKFDTYATCEVAEPVQFTGFKLFFHHDTRQGDALLTPRELLALRPRPVYIQYQ
jgi:hypothetical protein